MLIKEVAAWNIWSNKIAVAQVAFINREETAYARFGAVNATCRQLVFHMIKRASKNHEAAATAAAAFAMTADMPLAHVIHAEEAEVDAAQLSPYEDEKACCW